MCKFCLKVFITIIMIFSICFPFTTSSFADCNPDVEGPCVLVWIDHGIFFYDGTKKNQLTDNGPYDGPFPSNDWSPKINNSGEVVWYSYDFLICYFDGDGGGGGGGGCFVVTTAYGFRMPKKILTAAVFLSLFSIIFYKIRTKFKD